jgi:ABC-type glycerol-3-phosphate transport system substrate-binding protein
MWNYNFRKKQTHSCVTTRRRLSMQLEGDLPPAEAEQLAAHLATCAECRRWASAEQALHRRLLAEVEPPWIISPAAKARNRSHIQRRLRRKNLMLQTRQTVRGLAALVLLILFAAGVFWWWQSYDLESLAPINTPISQETEQMTIRLAVTDQLHRQIQPLIAAFTAENEAIDVQLVFIEATDTESYHRTVAETADVFISTSQRHPNPAYLLDLRPFIDHDNTFDAADFYPNLLLEDNNGRIQTIPVSAAYHVIYYNKALFDAADLPHPENGWTLDQFLAIAQQLTRRDGDEVTQWGYLPAITIWSPFLAAQLDAPIGQTDNPRFSDSDVIAAVNWLTELFTDYSGGSDNSRRDQPIRNGQVAMWENPISSYQQSAFIENPGIVSIPLVDGALFSEPLITGYSISAGTENAEAAWQLVSFLSRQPPAGQLQQYSVPARRSVAEAANYWFQLPPEMHEAVAYSVENTRPPQLWGNTWQIANLFPQIMTGNLTVEEALTGQATIARPIEEPPAVATPEPTAVTATSIQFVSGFNFQATTHRTLARAFHEAHPDISVSVLEPHIRMNTPYDPVAEIGEADCFVGRVSNLDRFMELDLLLPIDALLELDATTGPEDFYASSWVGLERDGQRYGLPAAVVPRLILYDRTKFAAAGLPDPALDWTLDELRQTAEALTTGSGDDKQYGFFDDIYRLARFHFDLKLIDTTLTPPTLDYSAAAPALRWYIDLTTLYGVHPTLPIYSDDYTNYVGYVEAHRIFGIEGNYAMWTEHASFVPSATGLAERNWGVAPLPVTPYGSGWHHPGNSAYFIMKDSEHRAACWQWITFLSREYTAADGIPVRIEVAESAAYVEQVGPQAAAVYQAALASSADSFSYGYPDWMEPGYRLWYDRALEQALHGADLLLELEQSQQHWDDYRACVIATDAFDNREAWVQCAIEVDPTLAGHYD